MIKKVLSFHDNPAKEEIYNKWHITRMLFEIESELHGKKEIKQAKQKLTELIEVIIEKLELRQEKSKKTIDKVLFAYSVIKKAGYTFGKVRPQANSNSFVEHILAGILDCDASSFVILALGEVLGWNIAMRTIDGHSFLFVDGFNVDLGEIKPDSYYLEWASITEDRIGKLFEPLYGKQIVSLFYHNRGLERGLRGLYDSAFVDFNKSLVINPYDIQCWRNAGVAISKYGDIDISIIYLHHSLLLNPNNRNTRTAMNAIKHEKMSRGRQTEYMLTIDCLNKFYDIDNPTTSVAKVLRELAEIRYYSLNDTEGARLARSCASLLT